MTKKHEKILNKERERYASNALKFFNFDPTTNSVNIILAALNRNLGADFGNIGKIG